MIAILHCNGYKVLEFMPHADGIDLPKVCRKYEEELNDGYCVVASSNGQIIADAEGYAEEPTNENVRYDAQYAYACGYHD